jgi:hypothetical protein
MNARNLSVTMVSFGMYGRETAARLRDTLRERLAYSILQPCKIGMAPMGGCFEVYLTTGYVCTDDEGNPCEGSENKARITEHLLAIMAAEVVT